jgi:4-methylaminobutanoate oxidase (formaldehyde-forming)
MITQADAVVIGAGAFGLSAALHLRKLGLRQVALVDQFEPASQTSPRAAGLFRTLQEDETLTRLARLSVHKVTHFEQEMGVPLQVVRSGSLMTARTPEHAALVRHKIAACGALGVPCELVGIEEAQRLAPFLEGQGLRVVGRAFDDLYIEEPRFLLDASLRACELLGVGVIPNTQITGIRLRDGAVDAVLHAGGAISTPVVVDAAGAWAGLVASLAGSRPPVVPVRHQLAITEPIEGIRAEYPIVRIIDAAVYIRPARGGLMIGGFESDPLPVEAPAEGRPFSMDDVPLDGRVIARMEANVAPQMPALRDAAVGELRGGLFTMTPDGTFLAGPVEEVPGLWLATGCNGSGFSLSPAIGQMLAEWIVGGEPSIDMRSLHPGRFADTRLDPETVRAKAVWQYSHYYDPEDAGRAG